MKNIQKKIALVALLFINCISAQENFSSSISYIIDANAKDDNLKENLAFLKKENNINLEVKNIKRNIEGKIIAIDISYNDNIGNSGSKQIKGTEPIKPITFNYKKNNEGDVNISLSSNETVKEIVKKHHVSDIKYIEDENDTPKVKSSSRSKVITITTDKDGKIKKSIIVNGEPSSDEEVIKIYKGGDFKFFSGADVKEILDEIDINKIIRESTDSAIELSKKFTDKNEIILPNMKELEEQMKKLQEEMEKMKKEIEENKKELKNTNKI